MRFLTIFCFCVGSLNALCELKEITILHTNDMHARLLGTKEKDGDQGMCAPQDRNLPECFGGFDRIYSEVQAQRAKNKTTLVLDAGDQFQGTLYHDFYKGLASARFMNAIGYDAMALGNHEFDNGAQILSKFINSLSFPVLATNIDSSKNKYLKNKIKKHIIISKNNIKIGIIGLITEDTAFLSKPESDIRFNPIEQHLRRSVLALKKANVDLIIALSHAGLARDIKLAQSIEGIAAIICGHSNSLLSNKVTHSDGPSPLVVLSPKKNPVLLVSAYAYGKYLGYVRFSVDDQGIPRRWEAEPILLDQSIARDPAISEQMLKLYEPIATLEKEHIGFANVPITNDSCRFEECAVGNLISDAMLNFTRTMGIDIALMNAGGIRASLPKGPINKMHIHEALPFEKKLVVFKLKGLVIKNILEHGLCYVEDKKNDNTGRFLQVAGLKYAFNAKKPKGQRLQWVKVYNKNTHNYEYMDIHKIYGVVTNSYISEGGDGYNFFRSNIERFSIDHELKDILSTYFKSPFSQLPKLEGRIIKTI
jgi:5'-nucleotidase